MEEITPKLRVIIGSTIREVLEKSNEINILKEEIVTIIKNGEQYTLIYSR